MSTTDLTPAPDAATVVADVHQALDDARTQALAAVVAVEHIDFGAVLTDAKVLIHDGIELLKQRVSELFHGAPTA